MASIIKPFSNLVAPGTFQVPSGQITVDVLHPLTRGLVGCWVPGATGNLVDLTGNIAVPAIFSNDMTQEGPGQKNVSSITNLNGTLTAPPIFKTGSAFTLYVRYYGYGAFDSTGWGFGVNYSQPDASPFCIWTLSIYGNGSPGGNLLNAIYNSAGGFVTGPNIALPDTGIVSAATTFLVGTSTVKTYINGVASGTPSSLGSAPNSSATSYVLVNKDHGNHNMLCGYMWNRNLDASEIAWVDSDPYGFLIPAEYDLPLEMLPSGLTLMGQAML